jgi:hypothetical protein
LGLKTLVIIITIIIIIIIICPIILGLTSDSSRKQSLVYSYSNNSAQKAWEISNGEKWSDAH